MKFFKLIIFSFLFIFLACGTSTEKEDIVDDDLIGEWIITKGKSTVTMSLRQDGEFIAEVDVQPGDNLDEETKSWFRGMTMDLSGLDENCVWRVEDKCLIVIDHNMNDLNMSFPIIKFNEDTLILDIYKKKAEFERT